MDIAYPEVNYVAMRLDEFSSGQHLYGCILHKGKRVHLLLSFVSFSRGKVTAAVLTILPPHQAMLDDKAFKKNIKLNVQSCYVYGKLDNAPFERACYFRSHDALPS